MDVNILLAFLIPAIAIIGIGIITGIVVSRYLKDKAEERKHQRVEVCPKCGGKIKKQKVSFNEDMGFEVAEIVCENGHEETVILK
ncbi:MAG: hypothetical protein GF308_15625 [Candidatus Heimdallarchaeota archaeon]|nr:hypothetical protein [Candidatus Heimdallarchaeota archaeon]